MYTLNLGERIRWSMAFVHLHVHSYYSLLSGVLSIDEIIAAARKLNMKAVALTDDNNLYGAVEFYEKALYAGIKPLIGARLEIAEAGRVVVPVAVAVINVYRNFKKNMNKTEILTRGLLLPPYTVKQRLIKEPEILGFAV